MVNMLQAREIKQAAAAAGFDLCGICRVRNFSAEQTFFEGWLERGFDGGLGYLRRNVEKRFSPAELMPGARSVVSAVSPTRMIRASVTAIRRYPRWRRMPVRGIIMSR